MLRLDRIIKPWKEAASLNDNINLYGFWNETTFLTKSGDVGMVLGVPGVDYESLDSGSQEYAVKRLEAALKSFGPGFRVYQYLFKSNRPEIPFESYDDPVVQTEVNHRREFFAAKRDHLYQVEIFYCVLFHGSRSKTGIPAALGRSFSDPAGAVGELKAQFSNGGMKALLRAQIERDCALLEQRVQGFIRQFGDFMQIEVLNHGGQLRFFRRVLNYDGWRIAGAPKSTQFLDYQAVNSDIEAERDFLRVGNHFVRVVTMKEPISETRPLVLDALLKIPGNFHVVTEWAPVAADKARKEVNKRRRHFNISKTGFISQLGNDSAKTNPRDVLVDESKQPYVVYEGLTMDAVLMNRLDGDAVGPVKVLVSSPVYSHDRQHVLIPDGTIVLGEARKIGAGGFGQQRRLAVFFHRMIMPDGYSVDLDQFHGLDQIGEEGLKDGVNNHYLEIFGTSIALGVISGAGQIEAGGGTITTSGSQAFTTGAASSVSQSATTVLDRFIQIPPTITIREGHRVKIYFTQDMLLPAYDNHTIPQTF